MTRTIEHGIQNSSRQVNLLIVVELKDFTVDGLRALWTYFGLHGGRTVLKVDLERGHADHVECRGVELMIARAHVERTRSGEQKHRK